MNNKEILIKRLQYQSWHRGCKETDIILGDFAKSELNQLNIVALLDFDQLLQLMIVIFTIGLPALTSYNTNFQLIFYKRLKNFINNDVKNQTKDLYRSRRSFR